MPKRPTSRSSFDSPILGHLIAHFVGHFVGTGYFRRSARRSSRKSPGEPKACAWFVLGNWPLPLPPSRERAADVRGLSLDICRMDFSANFSANLSKGGARTHNSGASKAQLKTSSRSVRAKVAAEASLPNLQTSAQAFGLLYRRFATCSARTDGRVAQVPC